MSGVIGGVINPAAVALKTLPSPLTPKLVEVAPLVSDCNEVGDATVEENMEPDDAMTVGSGGADVIPTCTFEGLPVVATVDVSGSKDDTVVAVEAADVLVDT